MKDLGTLCCAVQGQSPESYGNGINASGEVTGYSTTSVGTTHAFLWSNGAMQDLGALPGDTYSAGNAINASGTVTGTSDTTDGSPTYRAFVYSNGQMSDLNTLISSADAALYVLRSGNAINDAGQILANGYLKSDPNQNNIALLLTPTAVTTSATTTTLSAAPTSAPAGSLVTLTAGVKPATGTAVPTGTVNFAVGTAALGSSVLNASGQAILTTSSLPLGADAITATYSGSATDAASTSQAVTVTIKPALIVTSTTLTASPKTVVFGAPIEFSAVVKAASGAVPQGTVTFKRGAATIGSAKLSSTGTAKLSAANFAGGSHTVTASYAGDSTDAPSVSGVVTVTVDPVATTTSLSASPATAVPGAKVTLTATVKPKSGVAEPTGKVTFKSGKTTLGSATLNSAGVASLAVTSLPVGSDPIEAVYAGSADDAGSTSSLVTVTIT